MNALYTRWDLNKQSLSLYIDIKYCGSYSGIKYSGSYVDIKYGGSYIDIKYFGSYMTSNIVVAAAHL